MIVKRTGFTDGDSEIPMIWEIDCDQRRQRSEVGFYLNVLVLLKCWNKKNEDN